MKATFKFGIQYEFTGATNKKTVRYYSYEIEGSSARSIFKQAKSRLNYALSYHEVDKDVQVKALEYRDVSLKFKQIGRFLSDSDF